MSTTVTLPDLSGIVAYLAGKKTYITLAVGMIVVAANHFGVLPPEYVPNGLDPNNWVQQEWTLVLGAFANATQQRGAKPDRGETK